MHPMLTNAVKAARRAGTIINRASQDVGSIKVHSKNYNDFVSEVDHASERAIIETLQEAYPDHGFIGEESGNDRTDAEHVWIIDPLDGTVNYLYGLPGWNVSVAAKDENGVVAGVVYAPSINGFWSAVKGGGAFYNGEKIKCNEPVELSKALLATGFAYDLNLRISQGDTMAKLLPRIRDLRRNGAAAVDLCYVAMGALDGYFEASLKEWDHAAGGLIATEAGAVVSGPDGGAPSSELVVAAGPSLHAQLLPLI